MLDICCKEKTMKSNAVEIFLTKIIKQEFFNFLFIRKYKSFPLFYNKLIEIMQM